MAFTKGNDRVRAAEIEGSEDRDRLVPAMHNPYWSVDPYWLLPDERARLRDLGRSWSLGWCDRDREIIRSRLRSLETRLHSNSGADWAHQAPTPGPFAGESISGDGAHAAAVGMAGPVIWTYN